MKQRNYSALARLSAGVLDSAWTIHVTRPIIRAPIIHPFDHKKRITQTAIPFLFKQNKAIFQARPGLPPSGQWVPEKGNSSHNLVWRDGKISRFQGLPRVRRKCPPSNLS